MGRGNFGAGLNMHQAIALHASAGLTLLAQPGSGLNTLKVEHGWEEMST